MFANVYLLVARCALDSSKKARTGIAASAAAINSTPSANGNGNHPNHNGSSNKRPFSSMSNSSSSNGDDSDRRAAPSFGPRSSSEMGPAGSLPGGSIPTQAAAASTAQTAARMSMSTSAPALSGPLVRSNSLPAGGAAAAGSKKKMTIQPFKGTLCDPVLEDSYSNRNTERLLLVFCNGCPVSQCSRPQASFTLRGDNDEAAVRCGHIHSSEAALRRHQGGTVPGNSALFTVCVVYCSHTCVSIGGCATADVCSITCLSFCRNATYTLLHLCGMCSERGESMCPQEGRGTVPAAVSTV